MEKNTGPTPIAHMTPLEESKILHALNNADWKRYEVKNLSEKTFSKDRFGSMFFEVNTCDGAIRLRVFNDDGDWDYIESITWKGRTFKCPLAADPNRCFDPLMTRAVTNWHPRVDHWEAWGDPEGIDCDHWT